jgi:polyisoprenoid-binding protein YceI
MWTLWVWATLAAPTGPMSASNAKVTFEATGQPGFLSFEGRTTELAVRAEGGALRFVVPMRSVQTGISLRDAHLWDTYVEVGRFPEATLDLTPTELVWPSGPGDRTKGSAQAVFTVHGASSPVRVDYTLTGTATGATVTATFPFDVQRHGIGIPTYMGITIDGAMKASVRASLTW